MSIGRLRPFSSDSCGIDDLQVLKNTSDAREVGLLYLCMFLHESVYHLVIIKNMRWTVMSFLEAGFLRRSGLADVLTRSRIFSALVGARASMSA